MGITAGLRERSHGRDTQTSVDDRRRRALKTVAALLGAVGLELYSASDGPVDTAPLSAIPSSERETIERRPGHAWQQSLDIDGIPGLVSSVSEFYEVDINTINPDISASEWSLPSRELSKTNRPSTTLTSRRWSQSISSSPSDVGGSAQRRTHGYRALNRCAGPTAPCPYRCARVTCDASGCRRLL